MSKVLLKEMALGPIRPTLLSLLTQVSFESLQPANQKSKKRKNWDRHTSARKKTIRIKLINSHCIKKLNNKDQRTRFRKIVHQSEKFFALDLSTKKKYYSTIIKGNDSLRFDPPESDAIFLDHKFSKDFQSSTETFCNYYCLGIIACMERSQGNCCLWESSKLLSKENQYTVCTACRFLILYLGYYTHIRVCQA